MIKISKMSGKLHGIGAINTDTTSNEFCTRQKDTDTICGKCYSHRMLSTYRKSCVPAFSHNSELLSKSVIPADFLPTINQAYFRFNGHGELINATHYENIVNIARKNPHCTFTLWTKRASLVRDHAVPDNLILVFSNPAIDKVIGVPRGFHKVFNNVNKASGIAQNCTGKKCLDCLLCYRKDSGSDVIVEAVK